MSLLDLDGHHTQSLRRIQLAKGAVGDKHALAGLNAERPAGVKEDRRIWLGHPQLARERQAVHLRGQPDRMDNPAGLARAVADQPEPVAAPLEIAQHWQRLGVQPHRADPGLVLTLG